MKKILAIVTILTVLIVGCGNKENIETEKNRRTETREKTPISKLYDWKQAEIKNIGDGSNFGTEFVVQNEKYIFFPQNGNKVVRLDKNNKNVKTIYKFKESKEKEIGLHLCQGENGFFIEYEGNIFLANYDGSKIDKIISSNEIREEVSREITDIEDFCEICSIHYYNKKIYFISRMNIYEYNLATKEIKLLGEDLLSACFRKNELYYVSYGFTVIYKVNLSTYKRKRVCGKETIVSEVKNSDTIKYYKQIMEIENKIYYARQQNGKKPVIYQYCENGKDRKIYEYPIQSALVLAISGDSEKFVCECFTDGTRENIKLMIYDVKTSVLNEVNMHDDRITFESILGDMIFYAKDDSDYLSYCLF